LVKYPIESRNLSANTPHINRLLTRFTTSSQNSNLKAETLWRNGAVMESTLYVLAMCPVCRTARTLAAIRFLGGEAPDKLVRRHEMQGLIETGAVTIGFLVRLILPLLLLLLYSSWVERQAA
jgi:hypothetical protein